jgi:hypothetical protein
MQSVPVRFFFTSPSSSILLIISRYAFIYAPYEPHLTKIQSIDIFKFIARLPFFIRGVNMASYLKNSDPKIYGFIKKELKRQKDIINMIPSENYVSKAVLEATGSVLCNKYSEGYAGKRYYQGNRWVDEVENLAIERAKQLFGAEHANVQPYSGSPANAAISPS